MNRNAPVIWGLFFWGHVYCGVVRKWADEPFDDLFNNLHYQYVKCTDLNTVDLLAINHFDLICHRLLPKLELSWQAVY